MVEVYKTLIRNQYEAAFRTLKHCIDGCSDSAWNEPVCNHQFCQTVFHTLFFADVYLGENPQVVEDQEFHTRHIETFSGYEEWENRPPEKTYTREFINTYLNHCREKANELLDQISKQALSQPSGFSWINGAVAEVHVYNIRHLQHHTAQLSLRLRLDSKVDVPWVKSGWEK